MTTYQAIIPTPLGKLGIRLKDDHYLTQIDFLDQQSTPLKPTGPAAKAVVEQLQHYFNNPHHSFQLPIKLGVTEFQQRVLDELIRIPAGNTRSYGDIAKKLNTSPRTIGNACRSNPIPIVIPCHRVVAKSHLGGYSGAVAGHKMNIKKWLLTHEQA